MPIAVVCPSCKAKLKAPEALIGKKVKCPGCGTSVLIEAPEAPAPKKRPAPAEDYDDDVDEPRPAPKSRRKPEPDEEQEEIVERPAKGGKVKARARAEDEDEDADEEDRPRRKGKKGGGGEGKSWMVTLLLQLLTPPGVDRMYLGYMGLGIAKLLTCGGCGVWSLIDFISVLTNKMVDAEGRPLVKG
jgi:hypothetical protein